MSYFIRAQSPLLPAWPGPDLWPIVFVMWAETEPCGRKMLWHSISGAPVLIGCSHCSHCALDAGGMDGVAFIGRSCQVPHFDSFATQIHVFCGDATNWATHLNPPFERDLYNRQAHRWRNLAAGRFCPFYIVHAEPTVPPHRLFLSSPFSVLDDLT